MDGRSKLFLATSATLAALMLASCGGRSGDTSSSAGAPAKNAAAEARSEITVAPKRQPHDDDRASRHGSGSAGGHRGRNARVAPLETPGGGSAQFLVKGGDNSVQEYGAEASATELTYAAETVHSFFAALVRGEWVQACSLLAAGERKDLEKLASSSPRMKGGGCAAALRATTKSVSPPLARQLTTVDAASLRQEGEQAFLIYAAPPGRTVYAMPLRLEGGAWRLGAIAGAVLPGT